MRRNALDRGTENTIRGIYTEEKKFYAEVIRESQPVTRDELIRIIDLAIGQDCQHERVYADKIRELITRGDLSVENADEPGFINDASDEEIMHALRASPASVISHLIFGF